MAQNFIIFLCCGDIDHTGKCSKVKPSDGHISTTMKVDKILWPSMLESQMTHHVAKEADRDLQPQEKVTAKG